MKRYFEGLFWGTHVTLLTVLPLVKEPAMSWDGGAAPEPRPNSPAAQSSATKDLRQGGPPSPIPTSGTRQGPVSDGSGGTPMHLDSHGKMLRFSSRQANFYNSQADWEPANKQTFSIYLRTGSQSSSKLLHWQLARKLGAASR